MTSIPQLVTKLEKLPPEALEAVDGFVQNLLEAHQPRLMALTEEALAKLMPTLPDPPATGVWKKRNLADTDDW